MASLSDLTVRLLITARDQASSTLEAVAEKLKSVWGLIAGAFSAKAFIDANTTIENQTVALTALTGSAEETARQLDSLRAMADRLPVPVNDLVQSWIDLSAATKGTSIEGAVARDVFDAVAGAAAKLGASGEKTNSAMVAISQMAAKGVISMEELRGQLAEAIPGASQAMAKGLGVSLTTLNSMVDSGKLTSDVALPALARGLRETFGVDNTTMVHTLGAAFDRLGNSIQVALQRAGEVGASKLLASGVDEVTGAATRAGNGFVFFEKALGATAALFTGAIPTVTDYRLALTELRLEEDARDQGLTQQQAQEKALESYRKVQTTLLQQQTVAQAEATKASMSEVETTAKLAPLRRTLEEVTGRIVNLERDLGIARKESAKANDAAAIAAAADLRNRASALDALRSDEDKGKKVRDETAKATQAQADAATQAAQSAGREQDALRLTADAKALAAKTAQTAADAERRLLIEAEARLTVERQAIALSGKETQANRDAIATLETEVVARRNAVTTADAQVTAANAVAAATRAEAAGYGLLIDKMHAVQSAAKALADAKDQTQAAQSPISTAQEAMLQAGIAAGAGDASKALAQVERGFKALTTAASAGDRSATLSAVEAQLRAIGDRVASANGQVANLTTGSKDVGAATTTAATGMGSAAGQAEALARAYQDAGMSADQAAAAIARLQGQTSQSQPAPVTPAGAPADTGTSPTPTPSTQPQTPAALSAATQVRAAFATPIPLTFDVQAGAKAAAAQVVAAVQAALAGASFTVPVTAIVTVDAGGATPTGTQAISDAAAKRGTRTTP